MKKVLIVLCASLLFLACDDLNGTSDLTDGIILESVDAEIITMLTEAGISIPKNPDVYLLESTEEALGISITAKMYFIWSKSTGEAIQMQALFYNGSSTQDWDEDSNTPNTLETFHNELVAFAGVTATMTPNSDTITVYNEADYTTNASGATALDFTGWNLHTIASNSNLTFYSAKLRGSGNLEVTEVDLTQLSYINDTSNKFYIATLNKIESSANYKTGYTQDEIDNPTNSFGTKQ